MHGNPDLGQGIFPSPPLAIGCLKDGRFFRVSIGNGDKLPIRIVESVQVIMFREFVIGLALFGNDNTIHFIWIPLIVLNPFGKCVPNAGLAAQ